MPSNSEFSINNFSPDFRDALLNRNLLADTVTNNSLSSWLESINKPTSIGDGVGIITGSEDIEVQGPIYRDSNVKFSKINDYQYYTGFDVVYYSKDIIFPDPLYGAYSTSPISSPTNDGIYFRDENTIYNIFKEGGAEYFGGSIIEYENVNVTTNTDYIDIYADQNNPELAASFRRELSITQNQYKADEYEKVSLELLPFEINPTLATLDLDPNTYSPSLEAYTTTSIPANGPFQGGNIRQFNTAKNMYLDVPKQTRVDLNTQPMVTVQHESYLDANGNLNYGNTGAVQLGDILGSVLTGGGIGLDPNTGNAIPDFDIRSSLAGRALTSAGALDDTRLGQISPQFLAMAIGNNIAFNLQEETIGRVNTNPLSLAMGGSLIVPNNKITVKKGFLGKTTDIIERMTGAKLPVSQLPREADIFSYDTKGYIEVGNIERANAILENTGKGTVNYLFGNVKASINPSFLGNRQGYAPGFNDGDDEISNAKLYFLDDGNGKVKNILSQSEENSPIPQSSHNLSGIIDNHGFGAPGILDRDSKQRINKDNSYSNFIWGDSKWNKITKEESPFSTSLITNSTDKKSLLYKTQELFNSNNMRTLVSGKGKRVESFDFETTTNTKGFMSKGSAVLKNGGRDFDSESATANMFARAWSPVDSYNTYGDLQKHSRLSPEGRIDNVDVESSVLRDPGVVQIGPYSDDKNIKQFMFSLENLAWQDSTTKLMPCEIGPGDPLTGKKGRIMWFPPYDITINESVSASYDRTNFIGRGEPIYTYNNTERTGTLAWKIVVDHPNYLNFFKDGTDDDYAAFFAGALDVEEIRDRVLSDEEKDKYEIAKANKQIQGVPPQTTPSFEFNIYYPNDVSEVQLSGYEDGLTNEGTNIDYEKHPSGIVYKQVEIDGFLNDTSEIEKIYGEGNIRGGVSASGVFNNRDYPDRTNFGLNGSESKIRVSDLSNSTEENGWFGFSSNSEKYNDYFTKGNCKYCKFEIKGYASPQGASVQKNKELAKKRGENLKNYIINTGFLAGVPNAQKRITVLEPEAITQSGCKQDSNEDTIECKEDRKVTVKISYDSSLEKQDKPSVTKRDPNEPDPKFTIPTSRFYTECSYFEKIKETDSFVYSQFKDKIKNFHPAFHAITPEGFNSRLTFLQQCMRQGPTNGSDNPDNLAFGRAPVCILRLGDFYHTKIIIESLTIDYEPIVWDLNPEGVGVQPMIANVNISFAFIGGSSMKGPINRLQNAISFNYFANTELYDPRAERIVEGKIQEGNFPFSKKVEDRLEAERIDQEEIREFENKIKAEEESKLADISDEEAKLLALENDKEIIKAISINSYKATDLVGFALIISINNNDNIKGVGLQRQYYGELFIKNSLTNEKTTVGFLTAKPVNETSFKIDSVSWAPGEGRKDEATFELDTNPNSIGFLDFDLNNNFDYEDIINLLNPCGTTSTVIFDDIEQEVFTPCENGDHVLILEWTDNLQFKTSSKKVYNKANNNLN